MWTRLIVLHVIAPYLMVGAGAAGGRHLPLQSIHQLFRAATEAGIPEAMIDKCFDEQAVNSRAICLAGLTSAEPQRQRNRVRWPTASSMGASSPRVAGPKFVLKLAGGGQPLSSLLVGTKVRSPSRLAAEQQQHLAAAGTKEVHIRTDDSDPVLGGLLMTDMLTGWVKKLRTVTGILPSPARSIRRAVDGLPSTARNGWFAAPTQNATRMRTMPKDHWGSDDFFPRLALLSKIGRAGDALSSSAF